MTSDGFQLDIFTPAKTDVYLALPPGAEIPWKLVRHFDEAGIGVVADLPDLAPVQERVGRIVRGCSGVVGSEVTALRIGAQLGLPLHELLSGEARSAAALNRFCSAALQHTVRPRPYAFFVGRLERDFAHAREAIRVAVEREAGIPCLWVDDGRHRTNLESVRERTRLLVKHATFVIADLTLGIESPERENPSRAHEVGMAIAYGRKLMLSSQEPRRYPYFSIGDLQMVFWDTEEELERQVRAWIYASRETVARRVFNDELASPAYQPQISKPSFTFDPKQRYIGPKTAPSSPRRVPVLALSAGMVALTVLVWLILALRA